MFFKNLTLFRLSVESPLDSAVLAQSLAKMAFRPCSASETETVGWVAPVTDGDLLYAVGGQYLIALKTEEKILPASVVTRFTNQRVKKIEEEQDRKVGRKERQELKEQTITDLLPKAFTTERTIFAWIDPVNGWLAMDTASRPRAESVLECLRKCADGLPAIRTAKFALSPSGAMNTWITTGEPPAGFTIDQDLELQSAEQAKVRYVKHTLEGDEIRRYIAEGKVATKLALTWSDRISFVLDDKLQIRRLSFLDIIKEENAVEAESERERFDLDFVLMAGELAKMLKDLSAALGGEIE